MFTSWWGMHKFYNIPNKCCVEGFVESMIFGKYIGFWKVYWFILFRNYIRMLNIVLHTTMFWNIPHFMCHYGQSLKYHDRKFKMMCNEITTRILLMSMKSQSHNYHGRKILNAKSKNLNKVSLHIFNRDLPH